MNKPIAISAAIVFSAFCLAARCTAQDLDQAPIVHTVDFPTGNAAWNVSFKVDPDLGLTSPPKTKDKQKQLIAIVRKGDRRHDIVTWTDGSTTDYWWTGSPAFVLYEDGTDNNVMAMKEGNMDDIRYDASWFTWISKDTFKGMKTFEDTKCRYYERKIILPDQDVATERAWIDNKTARPLGWSETGLLTIFSFDAQLPDGPLVLPDKFQAALNRIMPFFAFPKRQPAPGSQPTPGT